MGSQAILLLSDLISFFAKQPYASELDQDEGANLRQGPRADGIVT